MTLTIVLKILLFIIAFLVMSKAGTVVVRSLIFISRYFMLSEYAVAFILMSFATSLPEFLVGLDSALEKIPTLSFGNLIGASIINLTLVIAASYFLTNKNPINTEQVKNDAPILIIGCFFPIIFTLDGEISRLDGLLLIFIFIMYIAWAFRVKKAGPVIEEISDKSLKSLFKNFSFFILGVAALLLSAWYIVGTATEIALILNAPLLLIGIFILAIGTTLPELIFSIKASSSNHGEMILGNAFGSVFANLLLIMGIVSLISPITIEINPFYYFYIVFFIISFLTTGYFIQKREKMAFKEALVLGSIYLLFIVFSSFF